MGRTTKLSVEDNYKNPGVCKGVQVVIVSGFYCIFPRAYFHRHRL